MRKVCGLISFAESVRILVGHVLRCLRIGLSSQTLPDLGSISVVLKSPPSGRIPPCQQYGELSQFWVVSPPAAANGCAGIVAARRCNLRMIADLATAPEYVLDHFYADGTKTHAGCVSDESGYGCGGSKRIGHVR